MRVGISFRADLPEALELLVGVAASVPGSFQVGPFDDGELLKQTLWIEGADEVEAFDVFMSRLVSREIAFSL